MAQAQPITEGQSEKGMYRPMSARNLCAAAALALLLAMVTSAYGQSAGNEGERRIVVSIPERRLALLEGGHVVKVYEVAVGTDATPSPEGEFTIVNRLTDPGWYAPGKVIVPGPANPLGTRWLGLSLKSFGIHGTNDPESIGTAASTGCIRLRNRDVEDLFTRVRAGDMVVIRAHHDAEMARIFAPSQAPAERGGEAITVATATGY